MRRFLIIGLFLAFFSISLHKISAAAPVCNSIIVSPSSGDANTTFTVNASGCQTSIVTLYKTDSQGNFSTIPGGDQIFINQDITSLGYQKMSPQIVGPFPEGTWTIVIGPPSSDPSWAPATQVVTVGQTQSAPLKCGDLVPDGALNPQCPQGCSLNGIPADLGFNVHGTWCQCGILGALRCPAGNALGLPPCGNGLVVRESDNVCIVDSNGNHSARYACGEMVFPEDNAHFTCGSCTPTHLSEIGPHGETYWCACGNEGQICCPVQAAQDCHTDGCNYKSGLSACNNQVLQCSANVCIVQNQKKTGFGGACGTNGVVGIDTAIGCIPIETYELFTKFFITWGLGVGGGVGLISLIIGAFMLMTSSGNPDQINKAKTILISSVSGIIILAFSVLILRIIGVDVLGLF